MRIILALLIIFSTQVLKASCDGIYALAASHIAGCPTYPPCPEHPSGEIMSAACSTRLLFADDSQTTVLSMLIKFTSCTGGEGIGGSTARFEHCDIPIAHGKFLTSEQSEKPILTCGSIIQTDSQILGEEIPIAGVSFYLTYFTNRVPGRIGDYQFKVPISGAVVDANTTGFNLEVTSSSETTGVMPYSSAASQVYTGIWDGKDANGQIAWGSKSYTVFLTEFNSQGNLSADSKFYVGGFKAIVLGLGAWVPSIYQFYDIDSQTLYLGDGRVRHVNAKLDSTTNTYSIAEEDGSKLTYFDMTGKPISTVSATTGTSLYSFTHGADGRLQSVANAYGQFTVFNRDPSGNLISITSSRGLITTVTLDSNGYLKSVVNPGGETYQMTYVDAQGLLKTFRKPAGQVSTFSYDSIGNLLQDSHSGGSSVQLSKAAVDLMTRDISSTTAMGLLSAYQVHEGTSSVTTRKSQRPDGVKSNETLSPFSDYISTGATAHYFSSQKTYQADPRFAESARYATFSQDIHGKMASSLSISTAFGFNFSLSNPNNPFSYSPLTLTQRRENYQLTVNYFANTRKYSIITSLGQSLEVEIDGSERMTSMKVGSLEKKFFNYAGDQLTSIVQGPRSTSFVYDSSGFLTSITDPMNRTTALVNDPVGRVVSKIDPDSRVTSFQYDANGNLIKIVTGGGKEHLFDFDSKELMSRYTAPSLVSSIVPMTSYTYDNDKRLTRIERSSANHVDFTYNSSSGQLTRMAAGSGNYDFTYEPNLGLLESAKTPAGFKTVLDFIGYAPLSVQTLDPSNNQISSYSRVYNDIHGTLASDKVTVGSLNVNIPYTYEQGERLSKAGDLSLAYDANGLISTVTLGGLSETRTYSSMGELAGQVYTNAASSVFFENITRNNMGQITSLTSPVSFGAGSKVEDFVYDNRGQLISRTTTVPGKSPTTLSFSYDNNSNRSVETLEDGTTKSYTYDNDDRLKEMVLARPLMASIKSVYTYTENGDLSSIKKYDYRNPSAPVLISQSQYAYDEFGNLKQVNLPDGRVVTYEIDAFNRRIGKKIDGVLQRRWVYQDGLRVAAEINASGSAIKRFVYGSKSNIPDYFVIGAEKYRIVSDHLGSVRYVVKMSDSSVTQRMDYDVFGGVQLDSNTCFQPFGFAGGIYDPDTKLIRFGARDYDPETGRWTSKDPILFGGGDSNLYGYVQNDPVNWTDPTGLIRDPRDIFDEALNHPNSSSGTNGPGNAFQHCFASCMMAGENGSATAAALGAGFEFINNLQGQKSDAYCMDTHNNQVGRDLAKENGISNLTGISDASHRGVSSACAQACNGANSSGRLVNLGGR